MKIDFVSDVVCPWCAVGLASLDVALRRLGDEVPVTLNVQPFELNPQMGPEGEDIVEHLSRKYRINAEQIAQGREGLSARGAAVGFTFGPRSRIWNTFDAHRLLHWAGLQGRPLALKRALLQAYHGRGENIADAEVLVAAVREAGLDAAQAADVLASGTYADEVRAAERHWQEAGISSVPAVILNDRYLISGGQPPEVFEQALRQVLAQERGDHQDGPATP
jgi:predicted DsbA family dithiol-disulfide isomerase